MTGLTLLVSGLWRHYARSFGDLATRAQLVQELRLATCSLAEDMGPAVGATVMGEGRLMICRDGGDAPNGQPDWAAPDQMVEYYLSQGRLIRHDCTGGAELTVAQDVASFSLHDAGSSLQMVLCMGKGGLSRQVTLLWSRPT